MPSEVELDSGEIVKMEYAPDPVGVMALAKLSDAEFEERLKVLKQGQKRIARIQREVMVEGVDYGVIPGTKGKPTLLKPGAEKLCQMYGLVPSFEEQVYEGDGIQKPDIRVVAKCRIHLGNTGGPVVGEGLGSASSWEKKYRYRKGERVCPECGKPAVIKGKEEYGGGWLCFKKKDGCGYKWPDGDKEIEGQQVGEIANLDPYDAENTYHKMSLKRAFVGATIMATATSGLFAQDMEDLDPDQLSKSKVASEDRPRNEKPAKPPKMASSSEIEKLHLLIQQRSKSRTWEATLKYCRVDPPVGWTEPAGVEQARDSMAWLTQDHAKAIEKTLLHFNPRKEERQEGDEPEWKGDPNYSGSLPY